MNNWWELSSKVEFLMLKGEIQEARSCLFDYYENDLSLFNVEITLRQLEMYRYYTSDKNATLLIEDLKSIKESL